MPKLEKAITERIRAEYSENLNEADNKKHREQVELINDLKRKETKHVETVNRLEKVAFLEKVVGNNSISRSSVRLNRSLLTLKGRGTTMI